LRKSGRNELRVGGRKGSEGFKGKESDGSKESKSDFAFRTHQTKQILLFIYVSSLCYENLLNISKRFFRPKCFIA
jgi:hypothetical protein